MSSVIVSEEGGNEVLVFAEIILKMEAVKCS